MAELGAHALLSGIAMIWAINTNRKKKTEPRECEGSSNFPWGNGDGPLHSWTLALSDTTCHTQKPTRFIVSPENLHPLRGGNKCLEQRVFFNTLGTSSYFAPSATNL
jgi:hypothetical protein